MAQNVINVGKGIQGDVLCVFAMTELQKHRHTAHESNKCFLDYLVFFNILRFMISSSVKSGLFPLTRILFIQANLGSGQL